MPLAITRDERDLGRVASQFAKSAHGVGLARSVLDGDSNAWANTRRQVADLGWLGLHLPERIDGGGGTLSDLSIVLEELGATLCAAPVLTSVASSAILARIGEGRHDGLLAQAASGEVSFGLGVLQRMPANEGRVSGRAPQVLGGVGATHFVLTSGGDVLLVAAEADGVEVTPVVDAFDPASGVVSVSLTQAAADVVVGAGGRARSIARALAAAEAAGGARSCLQAALAYANTREQFGRPIGSFQAIKHHLANMLTAAESAAAVAWDAARAIDESDEQGVLAAACAATVAFDAYAKNALMNIQVHGGIGFTWEHDAHLFVRRAKTLEAVFGPTDEGAEEVATLTAAGVRRIHSLSLPPEAEVFRAQARVFRAGVKAASPDRARELMATSGYMVPHWPAPWGRSAGPVEQLVIEEELAGIDVPDLGIGGWVLLTIVQHGSPEQLDRWVKAALRGEQRWCQLFSEPGAGSDAAAVRTRATRVDGGWLVNGQKVWTTDAMNCNRGLATVRTNPDVPKHKGIAAMAIDLTAPGVAIRPLREITGEAVFNEVFFDDVFVPDADVVGEVDNGWVVARATLGNERVSIGSGIRITRHASELSELASSNDLGEDVGVQRQIGRLIAAEQVVEALNVRSAARMVSGGQAGAEGALIKLLAAELAQKVTETAFAIASGPAIDGTDKVLGFEFLMARSLTIAGGTSEVSRNVIAERILGLPREPNLS